MSWTEPDTKTVNTCPACRKESTNPASTQPDKNLCRHCGRQWDRKAIGVKVEEGR